MGSTRGTSRRPRYIGFPALVALVGLAMPLSGCIGYDGDLQAGYVMDARLTNQVRVGSSAEQVLVVMGTPSTTSTIGGNAWYYVSTQTRQSFAFDKPQIVDRRIFAVYFDGKKKVERVASYGLEDGRVVDFSNRSTATAGSDTNFVKNLLQGLLKYGN